MDVILKNVSVGNLHALRVSVEHCIYQLEDSVDGINVDLKSSDSSARDKDILADMLKERKLELKEFKEILKQL